MSCLTCSHFNEHSEYCILAGRVRPPARVIAYGCPAWKNTDDELIEQRIRSGQLDFSAKPVPAPARIPASVVTFKKPLKAMDLDNWNDDIPF